MSLANFFLAAVFSKRRCHRYFGTLMQPTDGSLRLHMIISDKQ